MELLIIVFNKEAYTEKIISLLVEAGVNNVSLIDSEGAGHFLANEVPIFAGLRQLMGDNKTVNKIIMGVLEEKETFSEIKKLLLEEKIDFATNDLGFIITVPINNMLFYKEK